MNLIYTILVALPLGYFVKVRAHAVLGYLLFGAYLFAMQCTSVILDWLGDNRPLAFGPAPTDFPAKSSTREMVSYGLVNLVITVIGIGLVLLGAYLRTRLTARKAAIRVG